MQGSEERTEYDLWLRSEQDKQANTTPYQLELLALTFSDSEKRGYPPKMVHDWRCSKPCSEEAEKTRDTILEVVDAFISSFDEEIRVEGEENQAGREYNRLIKEGEKGEANTFIAALFVQDFPGLLSGELGPAYSVRWDDELDKDSETYFGITLLTHCQGDDLPWKDEGGTLVMTKASVLEKHYPGLGLEVTTDGLWGRSLSSVLYCAKQSPDPLVPERSTGPPAPEQSSALLRPEQPVSRAPKRSRKSRMLARFPFLKSLSASKKASEGK